jgi:protein-tyrosine phosphatase
VIRIIFVCTANRCRSPTAEAILRAHWAKEAGQGLVVSSMGIHSADGLPPTDLAIQVCSENGLDISKLRSRPLVPEELKQASLILVMEPVQKEFIKLFYPYLNDLIFLLGVWPDQADSKKAAVKDPVGGTIKDHRKSFKTLLDQIDGIIPLLRSNYGY